MYKNVLVPLDGSHLAECTLSHVESLFKDRSVGEITLLHIFNFDIPWSEVAGEKQIDINELRKPVFAASRKYLAEMSQKLSSKGIKVNTEALEAGSPAESIIDYAREKGMDLIVMATHGYTGFRKMMLGSVASGVLSQSPVPVLLIRPEACRV